MNTDYTKGVIPGKDKGTHSIKFDEGLHYFWENSWMKVGTDERYRTIILNSNGDITPVDK